MTDGIGHRIGGRAGVLARKLWVSKSPDARRSPRWNRRAIAAVTTLGLAVALTAIGLTSASFANSQETTNLTLVSPSYKPHASVGTTDDYHCTLLNPHVTKDSYVISSQFTPGSLEIHHAVLAVVPPALAATALKDNAANHGRGWTCFGAPAISGASFGALLNTPFLSTWAPGHGADILPKGYGIPFRAGSLLIAQVHYNLLVGDKPVTNVVRLTTVPNSAPLLPLHWQETVAPPDLPCPAGVTGPLCDRAASLANQARQFGSDEVQLINAMEHTCGRDPTNPPAGDTTSCVQQATNSGYILRVQPHMHLLGQSFSLVLNPGTPQARTVLRVPSYNFHDQKAYNLATPIPVKRGDNLQTTCTYDPSLAQELPILRKAPSHFVTWGDGSTDEMCMVLTWTAPSLASSSNSA